MKSYLLGLANQVNAVAARCVVRRTTEGNTYPDITAAAHAFRPARLNCINSTAVGIVVSKGNS